MKKHYRHQFKKKKDNTKKKKKWSVVTIHKRLTHQKKDAFVVYIVSIIDSSLLEDDSDSVPFVSYFHFLCERDYYDSILSIKTSNTHVFFLHRRSQNKSFIATILSHHHCRCCCSHTCASKFTVCGSNKQLSSFPTNTRQTYTYIQKETPHYPVPKAPIIYIRTI